MNQVLNSVLTLGLTGFCFAAILAYLSRKLKVEEDPRVNQVLGALPGANCGACGFAGCRAFAEAVLKEHQMFKGCIPGGKATNEKIAQIAALEVPLVSAKLTSVCRCQAKSGEKKSSNTYHGPLTCKAAQTVKGVIDCNYGCFGLGDCARACPTGAITIEDQAVVIHAHKCSSCGKCAKVCPRDLFEIVTIHEKNVFYVGCNNTEKGPQTMKVCQRGCIACLRCTKVSDSPFLVTNNLSRIDHKKRAKLQTLEEAKNVCPTKCIYHIGI